jgi:flagellar motor protein MotB
MTMEMMNPTGTGSASTTPVFQTHPDKINTTNNNSGNGNQAAASLQQLQQQHHQQQLLLQQQQQRQQQQLRQQQQQQLQQLPQTQAQLQAQAQVQAHLTQAHHQNKDGSVRQTLLKPTGSDYYAGADYSQYQYIEEEAADSGEQLRPMVCYFFGLYSRAFARRGLLALKKQAIEPILITRTLLNIIIVFFFFLKKNRPLPQCCRQS